MTPAFNYGVLIVAYSTYKHHRINFTIPQHNFTYGQICISKDSSKANTPYCCRAGACLPPLYRPESVVTAGASPRPTIYPIITQIGRGNDISAEIRL